MKPCLACHDTSPDDARFCITCGHAFIATGATERISSAGRQTQRLSDDGPWIEPSAESLAASYGSAGVFFVEGHAMGMGSLPWTYRSPYGWPVMCYGSTPIIVKVQS